MALLGGRAGVRRTAPRAAFEAILDDSGVPAILDDLMPQGGRPRQLGAKAVLLGVMLALDAGRPAHLEAAWRALDSLPVAEQLSLGFAQSTKTASATAPATVNSSDTFSVLCRGIDPTPVPSFRGVPDDERVLHLAAARSGVDARGQRGAARRRERRPRRGQCARHLQKRLDVAGGRLDRSRDLEPGPAAEDAQPANDPDASFGHAKRNAPGAKDYLFFGYYAQVATMVRDEGGARVPELVRRIAVHGPAPRPRRAS